MHYMHLQLFAEGGGETGGGEQAAAGGIDFEAEFQRQFGLKPEVAAPEQAEEKPAEKPEETTDAKQPETADDPQEDPDAEFEKLIKGKYKDAYGKRFQTGLNERFKSHNAEVEALKAEIAAYKDAAGMYAEKLGVDVNDVEALRTAAMADKAMFRAKAIAEGKTTEQVMQEYNEGREEARKTASADAMRKAMDANREAQQRQEIYAQWDRDAEEIRKTDPAFDLGREIRENEEFRKALDAGMSVPFAYRATHFEQRLAAVAGAVEKQTAALTAQKIAAGQKRPPEGGLNANPGAQTKVDYDKLSEKDFMALFNASMHY